MLCKNCLSCFYIQIVSFLHQKCNENFPKHEIPYFFHAISRNIKSDQKVFKIDQKHDEILQKTVELINFGLSYFIKTIILNY